MDDLKTIPKKNARRRGVMKGALATAGAAAAYAAPTVQKVSVALAQAVPPSQPGGCNPWTIGGQIEASATNGANGIFALSTSPVTFADPTDPTFTLSGNADCCVGCAPKVSLVVRWGSPASTFTIRTVQNDPVSTCCYAAGPCYSGPPDSNITQNGIYISGTGDYNLSGGGQTGRATIELNAEDHACGTGETGQSADLTAIKIVAITGPASTGTGDHTLLVAGVPTACTAPAPSNLKSGGDHQVHKPVGC